MKIITRCICKNYFFGGIFKVSINDKGLFIQTEIMLIITPPILEIGLTIALLAQKNIFVTSKKYNGPAVVTTQNSDELFIPLQEWFKFVTDPLSKCEGADPYKHLGMLTVTLFNEQFTSQALPIFTFFNIFYHFFDMKFRNKLQANANL